jgi:2,4-dienoyl-CoA reductase (NADPH2)
MHTGLEEHADGASGWRPSTPSAPATGGADCHRRRGARASGVTMAGGAVLNDASQLRIIGILPMRYIRKAAKSPCKSCIPGATAISRTGGAVAIQAPINRFTPHALSHDEILALIDDFARCAQLAREAGYDGVEVMGSEGYLINEFLAARTNQRDDEWGGDYARRMRFAVEVVRRCANAPAMILLSSTACRCSTWSRRRHVAETVNWPGD